MEKLKKSKFVTFDRIIVEPGILNQTGEVTAVLDFYSAISKTPNKWFCRIPIQLAEQDFPIRGITITFDYY